MPIEIKKLILIFCVLLGCADVCRDSDNVCRILVAISSIFHLFISWYVHGIFQLRSAYVSGILFPCHVKRWSKSMHILLYERKVCVKLHDLKHIYCLFYVSISYLYSFVWICYDVVKNISRRFRIYFQQIICCCCRLATMKPHPRNGSPQGILLGKNSNSDYMQGKSRLCKWIFNI